ncbi:hypothetical protein [Actinacidiphila oryziradicis]|nr:hypothetical protein [Actinacidiphila oryziradicis]
MIQARKSSAWSLVATLGSKEREINPHHHSKRSATGRSSLRNTLSNT